MFMLALFLGGGAFGFVGYDPTVDYDRFTHYHCFQQQLVWLYICEPGSILRLMFRGLRT